MSKPSPFPFVLFALVVAGMVLLVVLFSRREAVQPPLASVRAPAPTPPSAPAETKTAVADRAPPPALDVRAVAALLERLLAQRGIREREAVLVFKDEAALQRFLERAAKAGLTVKDRIDALRSVRVKFEEMNALRDDFAAHADDYANLNANNLFSIPLPPAREDRAAVDQVPFGNDALRFLGAASDRSAWGRGTTIAVLDTGIGADATFGAGRVLPLDIGLGTLPGNEGRTDGHGTAVAALAAGAAPDAPGVSPAANLISVRVTDQNGTSDIFTLSHGIVAAVDAGARVLNISLGGYATGAVLDAAIGYATQKGAIIVAAAGNDQAAQLAWPAADPRVISVGAVDKAEQQVSFSNSSPQLRLSAPGYGVQTAWLAGQRVYVDGTSASAPLVAGSIAAVMSQNPNLNPQAAADLLARTASDAGAPGADPAFGRGIVNLATAMNSGNPAYVDTAVASHYYNAETRQMEVVVQNRSGRTVSGLALNLTAGATTTTQTVPSLAPGETFVAKVPVNDAALRASGSLPFTTRLTNPAGVVDQVPANNQRTSVLEAPKK